MYSGLLEQDTSIGAPCAGKLHDTATYSTKTEERAKKRIFTRGLISLYLTLVLYVYIYMNEATDLLGIFKFGKTDIPHNLWHIK